MSTTTHIRWNDRAIKALKAGEQRYVAWDVSATGRGLRVAPSGRKSFVFAYRFDGRPRMMTIGPYGSGAGKFSLAAANSAYATAESRLEQGRDPGAELVRQKGDERASETVAQLAAEYIVRYAKPNKKSWRSDERILSKDVLPRWGQRKANQIKRRDVIALLDNIVDRGSPISANRTFAVVRKVFAWAISRDLIENTPCGGVKPPGKEGRRDRVLNDDEIRSFWNNLETAKMSRQLVLALRFMLITVQRKSEVLNASWSDIDDGWWTIPAADAKNGMPHRLWVSPIASEILDEARSISKGSLLVFESPAKHDAAIGTTSVNYAIRTNGNLGIAEPWTPHDLRRTAASRMTSAGVSRFEVKKILNHADPDITAVYDRHSYDEEKKQALEVWGNKLRAILSADTADILRFRNAR